MWCVAELDAEYIAKMEDVLAVYEKPYTAQEPVVCLDEKPVSLHADVRPSRAARPGHLAKRDNEYRRCGTANLFAIVEPKVGHHFTCHSSRYNYCCRLRLHHCLWCGIQHDQRICKWQRNCSCRFQSVFWKFFRGPQRSQSFNYLLL